MCNICWLNILYLFSFMESRNMLLRIKIKIFSCLLLVLYVRLVLRLALNVVLFSRSVCFRAS